MAARRAWRHGWGAGAQCLAALLFATSYGCGGKVVVDGATSGAGGGGNTSTGPGSGGAGGSNPAGPGPSSATVTSASSSTSGAGGAFDFPQCSTYIHVADGNNEPGGFDFCTSCASDGDVAFTPYPAGKLAAGGPPGGTSGEMIIAGCAGTAPNSAGISIAIRGAGGVGSYGANIIVSYTDPVHGTMWQSSPNDVWMTQITAFGAVGGVIQGGFDGVLAGTGTGTSDAVMGNFQVIRIPDQLAP
jgi:hypothetical protein